MDTGRKGGSGPILLSLPPFSFFDSLKLGQVTIQLKTSTYQLEAQFVTHSGGACHLSPTTSKLISGTPEACPASLCSREKGPETSPSVFC